ncbi:copper resistance protein CopC [Mycolicibacterium litorale]|nr:copper resistance protein CopC [Mycolicibacterium litorale]
MRAVAVALISLALLSSAAGIAAAHTALIASDPAKDAQISAPLTTVVLTFSESINPTFANVVVRSADGRDWVTGQVRVDGPRLTVDVGPQPLPRGGYTVGYRVVSADGHPVSGSYAFTITAAPGGPTSATPSASSAPAEPTASPAASPSGPDTRTSIISAGIAGLALGGIIAFIQSRRRRNR